VRVPSFVGAPWYRAVSYVGNELRGWTGILCTDVNQALEGTLLWLERLSARDQHWPQGKRCAGQIFLGIDGEGGFLSMECMWGWGQCLGQLRTGCVCVHRQWVRQYHVPMKEPSGGGSR
jgi:hypothetical protein